MIYDNENVRRRDRLMDEARALQLLREAEYGMLSMIDEDGLPYGIPINYVWDGDSALYLHCAMEGRKLRALRQHPEVSFCVVGRVHLLPEQFSTEYESLVLQGVAALDLPEEERWRAIDLLLQKLAPHDVGRATPYVEKSFPRTNIIRLDISRFSGKRKQVVAHHQ